MNITLCNGKGGVGKTSACVLLAAALAEAGRKVAVLDLDPQGTARAWLRGCEGSKIAEYVRGGDYDVTLIDTPPAIAALPSALAACDVAILICSPSPADAWTTKATAEAIRANIPKGARLRLLYNGVGVNTVLARDLPALSKRIGVPSLRSTISRRQCYQHFFLLGWPALDAVARGEIFRAAIEIVSLSSESRR